MYNQERKAVKKSDFVNVRNPRAAKGTDHPNSAPIFFMMSMASRFSLSSSLSFIPAFREGEFLIASSSKIQSAGMRDRDIPETIELEEN